MKIIRYTSKRKALIMTLTQMPTEINQLIASFLEPKDDMKIESGLHTEYEKSYHNLSSVCVNLKEDMKGVKDGYKIKKQYEKMANEYWNLIENIHSGIIEFSDEVKNSDIYKLGYEDLLILSINGYSEDYKKYTKPKIIRHSYFTFTGYFLKYRNKIFECTSRYGLPSTNPITGKSGGGRQEDFDLIEKLYKIYEMRIKGQFKNDKKILWKKLISNIIKTKDYYHHSSLHSPINIDKKGKKGKKDDFLTLTGRKTKT